MIIRAYISGLFFLCFATFLVGCASTESHTYKLYPGSERPLDELVTLDLSGLDQITIDGLKVNRWEYNQVLLLPGEHQIELAKEFGFSVLVDPAMLRTFGKTLNVNFEAGKTYRLIADRTTGQGYRIFFWIEESDSGQVVAGEKKP